MFFLHIFLKYFAISTEVLSIVGIQTKQPPATGDRVRISSRAIVCASLTSIHNNLTLPTPTNGRPSRDAVKWDHLSLTGIDLFERWHEDRV